MNVPFFAKGLRYNYVAQLFLICLCSIIALLLLAIVQCTLKKDGKHQLADKPETRGTSHAADEESPPSVTTSNNEGLA